MTLPIQNSAIAPFRTLILLAVLLASTVCTLVAHPNSNTSYPLQSQIPGLSTASNEASFLILTDIHFDPFTGTDSALIPQLALAPVERWQFILESQRDQSIAPDGADANYALLASALQAARSQGAHYDYILVSGDFLGHRLPEKYRHYYRSDGVGYDDFVIKTMSFVDRMIEQSFPAVPIYAAFGNNDSVTADYAPQGPALLAAMAKEWKTVAVQLGARKDFLSGGYYAVPHPTVSRQEFVVLNTVYWSSNLKSADIPATAEAGSAELSWLAAQLDRLRAAGKTAALVMHIPPGIDPYDSAKPGRCATPGLFWSKQYLDSFIAILESHKDVIRDGYAGHTHIDDFRVFSSANGMPYFQIHLAPSIGRDHHNNPGFEVGVYDKTSGNLVDYSAAYLRSNPAAGFAKPSWTFAYDFRQQSHLPSYSPAAVQTIALLIRSSDAVRSRIMDLYDTRASSLSISPSDWRFYSCAQTEFDRGFFSACACPRVPQ